MAIQEGLRKVYLTVKVALTGVVAIIVKVGRRLEKDFANGNANLLSGIADLPIGCLAEYVGHRGKVLATPHP